MVRDDWPRRGQGRHDRRSGGGQEGVKEEMTRGKEGGKEGVGEDLAIQNGGGQEGVRKI